MNEVKMIYFSRPFYYPVKDGTYKHEDFHIGLLIGRKRALAVLVWRNHKPYAKDERSGVFSHSMNLETHEIE